MNNKMTQRVAFLALAGCMLLGTLGSVGCQTVKNGQTLPSPHYQNDDIQYFPAGPEFPYPREANAMEQQQAEMLQASQQRQ